MWSSEDPAQDPPLTLPSPPSVWPTDAPWPQSVDRAVARFRATADALVSRRRSIAADIRITPTLEVLRRDDPPRPAQVYVGAVPEAEVRWAPLRSETLLAEARVFEAVDAWVEAWRDALVDAWSTPVALARARAEVEQVEAKLRDVTTPSGAAEARKVRTLELDLLEARYDLAIIEAEAPSVVLPGSVSGRVELTVVAPEQVEALPSYRAEMLRAAADVARSERRRIAALVPSIGVAVGYAGSHARIEGRAGLELGRPVVEVEGAWVGTQQERAWASLGATFRLGTDAADVAQDVIEAHKDLHRAHASFVDRYSARRRATEHELVMARERWALAEDWLRQLDRSGDEDASRTRSALDAAGRDWLRYLKAVHRAASARGGWPGLRTPS